jgi:WD repeat-containing protein 23
MSPAKPSQLAILHYNGIQIHVAMADDEEDDTTQRERSEPYFIFTLFQTLLLILRFAAARQRRQILRLLANSEIRRLFRFATDDEEFDDVDEDDEDFSSFLSRRRIRTERPDPDRFPKVPSDEGTELMNSGIFGSNEIQTVNSINRSRKKKLAMRILDRELATEGYAQQRVNQRLMAQVRQCSSCLPFM